FADTEVWITSSWLVYLSEGGTPMKFFRLDSLILIYALEDKAVLIDLHCERLEIACAEADRAQLLAEILVRVPCVLNHFDAKTEKTWRESTQAIITLVEKRRQTIQQKQETHEGEPTREIG